MVIDGLGLNRDQVISYVSTNKPNYTTFEAWCASTGTNVNPTAIRALNDAISQYVHDDATRGGIVGASGIPDDANAPKDAIGLNNLDDWQEFYDAEIRG